MATNAHETALRRAHETALRRWRAKEKYVNALGDPLALSKMTSKLTTYLKHPITETSPPVANWQKGQTTLWFEKCYKNMRKAYGAPEEEVETHE